MSEEVIVDNIEYVSSKRAAEMSGYAQDYVGQLARAGSIDAKRIGGLWYISVSSIESHKKKSEASSQEQPTARKDAQHDLETIISFEGRDYVSAARAAKISGYNQDYVGQLARSGKILSRQVGSRWYVDRESLLAHKKEKDALLAAVQSQSVGLQSSAVLAPERHDEVSDAGTEPFFTYKSDTRDLIPALVPGIAGSYAAASGEVEGGVAAQENERRVPIHISRDMRHHAYASPIHGQRRMREPSPGKRPKIAVYGALAATLATIVIVLSLGVTTLREQSLYAAAAASRDVLLSAPYGVQIAAGLTRIGDMLEDLLVPKLTYRRIQ